MFIDNELYENDIYHINQIALEWDLLRGSSILITGATGMIGTVLVDVLMQRNQDFSSQVHIYALGRNKMRCQERFGAYLDSPWFTFIQGDVNEGIDFSGYIDYIFHCASNTHPAAYASDPIRTIMTNVKGTDEVLQLAVKTRSKRVVFLSTVEVYGENRGDTERFAESYCGYIDCNTLRAGYPEGKRAGEALCQAYIHQYGTDIVIPRICRVYGPTMLPEDSKALSQFIKNAAMNQDIVLKSAGMQLYSYCYVMDAAAALFFILLRGKGGETYNIADARSDVYLKDIAEVLAGIAGTNVVFQVPDSLEAKGFSKATKALLQNEKLRGLGWKAMYDMEIGLRRTVALMKY